MFPYLYEQNASGIINTFCIWISTTNRPIQSHDGCNGTIRLSLDLAEMEEVLRLGGMAFQDGNREQEAYKYLFTAFYGKEIDECNAFLKEVGVTLLGTQQRL